MRLKIEKSDDKKEKTVNLRLTLKDYYSIKRKALVYTDGNISEFLTYAGKYFSPIRDDLEKGPLGNIPLGPNNKRIKRR